MKNLRLWANIAGVIYWFAIFTVTRVCEIPFSVSIPLVIATMVYCGVSMAVEKILDEDKDERD